MASELQGGETVLTGLVEDRSALFGVLVQIEAFGLELLELRQIAPGPTSRESGGERTPDGLRGEGPDVDRGNHRHPVTTAHLIRSDRACHRGGPPRRTREGGRT